MAAQRLLSASFVLGFAANFLHSLAFHSYLHLPGHLAALGADEFAIGIYTAAMALSAIASRPFIGRIIDRRGRRTLVLVGGLVNIAASACYPFIDALGLPLLAVRVGHGIAEGMLFSVLFTIAADVVPIARRTEGIALFGVSGMVPLSLAGLIGDAILERGTYDDLFWFTVVAAVLGTLASLPLPDSRPHPSEGDAPARPFFEAIFQPALRPIWLAGFAYAVAVASYFTFLKTFVLERDIGSVGGFFSVYTVAAVSLRLFFGWLPDRLGAARVLPPAIVFAAAGVAILALATSNSLLLVAGVLCGIGHGYAFPIASALVVARSRASERGATLSAFTALFDLGLLIGSPILGWVAELTDYRTMFGSAAGVALLGAITFVIYERVARGRPRGTASTRPVTG